MRTLSADEMDSVVGGQDLCDTLLITTALSCYFGLAVACLIGSVGHGLAC